MLPKSSCIVVNSNTEYVKFDDIFYGMLTECFWNSIYQIVVEFHNINLNFKIQDVWHDLQELFEVGLA